ncbi:hypothetical protein B0H17DRAFT_1142286 [Mycena rosella]|uniref:Uncharacterized protein n=1 Tax=Mycena rosella TaxID=1033263 RepID=A0AAD7G5R3_MYCRO|nr:hypothetical protein B0H17DRAFT_1142286 [Mycena rosella]
MSCSTGLTHPTFAGLLEAPGLAVGASAAGTTSSDSEPAAGIEPQAQAPLGTVPSPVIPLASPLYPGSPSIVAPSPPPSALNQASVVATHDPNVLSAKSTSAAVAFAVPLSVVAAIILLAGGLFLKHGRGLGAQRAKDVEKLSRIETAST